MKILKVKILRASPRSCWYRDIVGETVFVKTVNTVYEAYEHIQEGHHIERPPTQYLNNEDVELLEEFEGDARIETIIKIIKGE